MKLKRIFLLLFGFNIAIAEYQIHADVVPSYLNYSFYNLSEEVFPADLTIIIHLSKVLGTLLYSVDSNDNQLIISINDDNNPTLDIEFSKAHIYVSIAKLCNLEWSKYTKLSLRIQMREVIYLQCNDGPMDSYKYQRTHKLNKDYPIPSFTKSEKMQAKLWLVNTPHMDGIYPNNAQLSGCIFDVLYKKQSMQMGTYRVGDKCTATCTKNICNLGQCLETYNSIPVCNCTSAFNNGDYCNTTRNKGTFENSEVLQFKVLKIVFKSTLYGKIFKITNSNSNITLATKTDILFLQMESKEPYRSTVESVVTGSYSNGDLYIVILTSRESSVDLQFLRKGSNWTQISIPYYKDVSREVFNKMLFYGDEIYCGYKNNIKEIRWMECPYSNKSIMDKKALKNSTPINKQSTISSITQSSNAPIRRVEAIRQNGDQSILGSFYLSNKVHWMFAMVIILNIIILVAVAVLFYNIRKGRKNMPINEDKHEDSSLLLPVDDEIVNDDSKNVYIQIMNINKEPCLPWTKQNGLVKKVPGNGEIKAI